MQGKAALKQATLADAEEMLALRAAAEDWLEHRGIHQWIRGEVLLAEVCAQVDRFEWWVVGDTALHGALRLLWSDQSVWPPDDVFAAYVHGLVIDRSHSGTGLGSALLRWVEDQAQSAGASAVRLDCVESNDDLRRYYTQRGFREVGRRDFDGPWFSAVLMEKRLA